MKIYKPKETKLTAQSVKQNLAIPAILHNRAMKFQRDKGENVPSQIRVALSEYLTKNNY